MGLSLWHKGTVRAGVIVLTMAFGELASFGQIAGVSSVRKGEGSIQLQVTEVHRAVPALLEELARQGRPLTELRTHSATLEDVFVALTGRLLRDA